MKLVDTDETILLVTGSEARDDDRDRAAAAHLQEEVAGRADGQSYRRAIVVTDAWFLDARPFHLNPAIAIGGPGVNGLAASLVDELPVAWSRDQKAWVQVDFDQQPPRALLWGMDAAATGLAVQAFVEQGFLDDLLRRIWRFRTEVHT